MNNAFPETRNANQTRDRQKLTFAFYDASAGWRVVRYSNLLERYRKKVQLLQKSWHADSGRFACYPRKFIDGLNKKFSLLVAVMRNSHEISR